MSNDNQEVGFKPSMECPNCKKRHVVKLQWQEIPILACPELKDSESVLFFEKGQLGFSLSEQEAESLFAKAMATLRKVN